MHSETIEMRKVVGIVFAVLVLGLWVASATHTQQSVGGDDATVQAQLTAVLKPTPSPTP